MRGVYDRFTKQGINLSAYNNLEIANDIVYVMEQLGYDKFSVFGSSFGTLVAQYLLLHHDERLVSVVMNATVDLNRALYGMHTNSLNALDTLFERCANNEKYAAAFPDLKKRFIALLEKLNAHPEKITVKYGVDGKDYEVIFNGNKLSVWLFAEMYWNTQIPLTLHKLLAGDYSEIQARPGMIFPIHEFSNGLSLSILFSELPEIKQGDLPINGEYASFVKGCGTMIFSPLFLSKAQEAWPVRKVSSAQKTLTTDVPILMLSGEMDHVCPPSYATELSEKLKNAHLFVFPGVAHSPVDVGRCGILMTKEFFDDPSKAPDSACMSVFKSEFVLPE